MPTTGGRFWKGFAKNSYIIWFSYLFPLVGIPYLWKAKNINLWSIDPYAFAISNQIEAAEDFLALASFNTDQTMDKCSQQPGTFSMQPFCTDKLIILLFWTRWLTNRLEIRLKKSLPSTFKRAIGQKSEIEFLDDVFDLGI